MVLTNRVMPMKQTLLVLLLVLSGIVAPAAEPPVKRLNILFFTPDDMNFDSSGVCGGPIKDLTPNLDRLAAEGLRLSMPIRRWPSASRCARSCRLGFTSRGASAAIRLQRGYGLLCRSLALVDQPLADLQIGLPSSWIQPDNSDNKDKPSDFYAYYTRLEYDDHSNTGQYADLIVKIGTNGRFVFSREFGYLPYWQPSGTKYFVDRLLPVTGDGPPERPDAINKCSYVRLIESSPDRIVVHWRYAPDLNGPHFTISRGPTVAISAATSPITPRSTSRSPPTGGSRGKEERLRPAGRVERPLEQDHADLRADRIRDRRSSTTPARLQRRPGDTVPGAPVVKGGVESPRCGCGSMRGSPPRTTSRGRASGIEVSHRRGGQLLEKRSFRTCLSSMATPAG